MDGRGGSSGMAGKSTGFSYKRGNRTVTVQRTAAGVTLVDGSPRKVDYDTLRKNMSQKEGFKNLTAKDLQEKRERRFEDHKGRDYELGLGIGNNREYRKTARSNRLINRIMSKR
ncbi:hypothetical protein [Clostridium sp. AF35-15]|uniref:hypothetical protein n=1 Tax=Clostridium sp. AF35-15 TaxID=2293013 RepID=UPI0011C21069|nr:hypothetical protein [Clostridium sp. AF35-15]